MTDKEKEFKKALQKIGFDLRHVGCEHYVVVSDFDRELNVRTWHNQVEVEDKSMAKTKKHFYHAYVVHFDLATCIIQNHDENGVSIGPNKGTYPFILFHACKDKQRKPEGVIK